jgi:hypothetical protein
MAKIFSVTLTDNAMTTAWITMLALLLLGAVGDLWKTFPLQIGTTTVGFILLTSGMVGLFESLYEKGNGFGVKILKQHLTNFITIIGAAMALILALGVFFNISVITSALSVWITLMIQFVILLAEGVVKRW